MKSTKFTEPVVKKSVSLPADLLRHAARRARAEQRTLSNYLATLLRADVAKTRGQNRLKI